ncbi:Anthranilate phosphoribosyltransferase [Paenibacillus polymyxa E681]|uniref:anthranilate phosphoribosyltransferase n=1 Tax=Paenibacillus polymyxa TaxID=1406 RepID=UPI0001E31BB0|nr:anthranilate phosphoribosyltransferase [Paenibacillus polymyxa]ADM70804.1 anthranilate phosphoribosyltransferase [Paenibacillus polymyxa E681]QNV57827.1 Anthranilate phosphoribosyltransferase [Paenibacillus polymyxa E681]QNV62664.1 Anthranilate phosphoribosyltransferase [Paenibacillus polymyxa E681]
MNIIEILKEVGRGKRGARDLNYAEAEAAAELIMTQSATPAQIGAFFAAERIKMESVAELEAFVNICRKYTHRFPMQEGIDFAGPYDGRKSSFIATFATAFLLASCGIPVTMHGSAPLPPKWGVTLPLLLQEMGVTSRNMTRETAIHAAKLTGVLFVASEQWCARLRDMRPIREELGLRTVLNTAEKLVDYGSSPYIVFGVFHNTVFEKTGKLMQNLNYRRALIVQGSEGSEDLFIDRPTRTYLLANDEVSLQVIDPEMYGLDSVVPEHNWTPAEQLRITEEVLQGTASIAFSNQVLLNSAVRLFVAGRVDSIEEGLYTCKPLLENGDAWDLYCHWREAMLRKEIKTGASRSETRMHL